MKRNMKKEGKMSKFRIGDRVKYAGSDSFYDFTGVVTDIESDIVEEGAVYEVEFEDGHTGCRRYYMETELELLQEVKPQMKIYSILIGDGREGNCKYFLGSTYRTGKEDWIVGEIRRTIDSNYDIIDTEGLVRIRTENVGVVIEYCKDGERDK